MEPQKQNQSPQQSMAPDGLPNQTASSFGAPERKSPSLGPLWLFLTLLAIFFLIVLISLVPSLGANGEGGPFEGGYLLLVITLFYFPIFIMTQVSATRAVNKVISVKYLTKPTPVFIRLLPLIMLAAVLLIVTAVTYFNYVQTNNMLAHCPMCAQNYPFDPAWNITAAIVLMSPYLLMSAKNLFRR